LFFFTVGVSFILATVSVFMRDMFYIYGILLTVWTYLTPIMYDIKMINSTLQIILKCNPLYQFINFARTIILYGQCPSPSQFGLCLLSSVLVLFVGLYVFRKKQDKFIYYI
ncbi:MAG: ABC transporter permease, partial [Malacoplasma sp.]